jgi:hypothetical protein
MIGCFGDPVLFLIGRHFINSGRVSEEDPVRRNQYSSEKRRKEVEKKKKKEEKKLRKLQRGQEGDNPELEDNPEASEGQDDSGEQGVSDGPNEPPVS